MDIYIGLGIWVFIYLLYLLEIVFNKKHLNKYMTKGREVNIVKRKFKINFSKINPKLVANMFGICNGAIIGLTYVIMTLIKGIILKLFAVFFILIILVLLEYYMLGNYFKGKEEK